MKVFHSFSSEETKTFGAEMAESLIAHRSAQSARALVIALRGDLGAGKTTFTQGFFRGLGIRRNPISPTFVIMRRYKVPADRKSQVASRIIDIYHFDAYRLKKAEDAAVLEIDQILADPKNIILIEWPEQIKKILPKDAVWLEFEYGQKENERVIKIKFKSGGS
jgi:tRNA threonylcarbamoyladenosine biosynthesis protein TsaE